MKHFVKHLIAHLLVVILLILSGLGNISAQKGSIAGIITDSETGDQIPFASVGLCHQIMKLK